MPANVVGHRIADRDVRDKAKKPLLDAIVPADAATRVLKPGLMNDQSWFSQDQCRKQTAKADVVLKKQITPMKQTKEFRNRWSPSQSIIRTGDRIAGGLGNDVNFIAGVRELFGENF